MFTLTRRAFLAIASDVYPSIPTWSYLASYDYGTPILGTFHASDILTTYGITPTFSSASIQRYYINFVNSLDPNTGGGDLTEWPQWSEGNELLHFESLNNSLLLDDFRNGSYTVLVAQGLQNTPFRI